MIINSGFFKKENLICLIPAIILISGSLIHYQRGYYGAGLATMHGQGIDDAYISYRYGWNLAHYGILSWNESGYRRTEGFTNPLWVLGSFLWSLPGDKDLVYPLSVITSVFLSTAFLIILTLALYRKGGKAAPAVLGLIMISSLPAIWLHVTSGLESGIFGLGLGLLIYLIIFDIPDFSSPILITLLSIFIGLLRSDGFVYLLIAMVASIISKTRSWKYVGLGLLVSSFSLMLWRYLEFRTFLPNTAIAKVNFSLLERIKVGLTFLKFILYNSGMVVVFLFAAAGLKIEGGRKGLAGISVLLSWLLYYLIIGGDGFFERHLVGVIVLCGVFSAPLWMAARRWTRVIMAFSILMIIVLSITRFGDRFDYFSPKTNDPWVMLGKAVAADRGRYGVLITFAAGKIPFYAGGDCIDSIGLNDPYLATLKREKFIPGHSSGSELAAVEIAKAHPSGVYSMFSYLDSEFIDGPEDIALWVDNHAPQDSVQTQVTLEQFNKAREVDSIFHWSIITEPVIASPPIEKLKVDWFER